MGLRCKLFTTPVPDKRLEDCLIRDSAHITPGSRGEHVRKIQRALNLLSAGRQNVRLKEDGWYGAKTAAAVKAYKNAASPRILQPWQKTADDIVGRRTLAKLDAEMEILENEVPLFGGFVSPTIAGAPHDHRKCPGPPRVTGDLFQGRASHKGTPINPKRLGRMINIYGEGETDYIGFVDFATEPQYAKGRPLTSTLPDRCASDICIRNAPISAVTEQEIKRLARPVLQGGCRFTYASNQALFRPPATKLHQLGVVIQQGRLPAEGHEDNTVWDTEVWVIELR